MLIGENNCFTKSFSKSLETKTKKDYHKMRNLYDGIVRSKKKLIKFTFEKNRNNSKIAWKTINKRIGKKKQN